MIPQSLAPFIVDKPKNNWRSWGDPDSPLLKVLRFADEAEMRSEFEKAGIAAPDGMTLPPDFSWPGIGDISIIGKVVDQDAVYGEPDREGNPVVKQEATFLDGWYVNVLVSAVAEAPSPSPGEPSAPRAPLSVSPRQARLALHALGLLDQVDALVAQGPAELRISWEFSTEVRRDDPGVIALATHLGIADRLPELFTMAAGL
jgi:hypothetical protein